MAKLSQLQSLVKRGSPHKNVGAVALKFSAESTSKSAILNCAGPGEERRSVGADGAS